jgi:hypothetical protein
VSGREPLYDAVGREPMDDATVEAALAAYRADHPGERTYVNIESRFRRLNAEARERAEAEATGISVWARHQARDEAKARRAAERDAADLNAARRDEGVPTALVPGAPKGSGPSVDDVARVGEELRSPDGTAPTQEAVAERLGCSPRWVSSLCSPRGGYHAVVPYRK